jgi:photosystem II stability/assembly factor-like uncharacterized protein
MKITSILSIFLFTILISCTESKNSTIYYASDNPIERAQFEKNRIVDPITGEVPQNIRKKERMFAQTLPKAKSFSKNSWQSRGPYNVGGRTRALCFDVLDENTILAGGASGGMFRSTDGGQSWNMTTNPNQEHKISCLTQDRRDGKENVWYFATGENRGSYLGDISIYGNGVFKSIDGGLSWDSLPITTTNTPTLLDGDFDFTFSIKTDESNDTLDVVYVATRGDIYRTEDGGSLWNKELGGPNNSYYQYTDVEVTTTGVVYATLSSENTQKGIWRSSDGQTWKNITDSLFAPNYSRVEIGIDPSNENIVYFIAAETNNFGQYSETFFNGSTWTSLWKYEYVSGDGSGSGGIWTDLSVNIPAGNTSSFDNFNAQGSYDLLVSVHPSDPNLIIIGGTNLWRSTDGFTSDSNTTIIGGYLPGSREGDGNWGSYTDHHPDQHEIIYYPSNDSILLNGNDGGIYRTDNVFDSNVSWTSLNNGYNTTQLYTATISKNPNSEVMHAGLQDNGCRVTFSTASNSFWEMPFNGDGMLAAIADNEEDFYMSIQRGVLYKMKLDNTGARIDHQRMDPSSCDSTNYMWKNPFAMDANNDNVVYWAEKNKLWRNNDIDNIPYNNSHQKSDFGWHMFTDTLQSQMKISTITTSVNPPNIVYYGTQSKYMYRIDDANIGDPPKTQLAGPPTGSNSYCHDIAVNPENADEIIVVYSNYSVYSLFHSLDGGQSWEKIAGNLEEFPSGSGNGPSCRTAAIIPFANDTLYLVGTTVGLFGTTNLDGINTVWEQIGFQDFGNTIVEDISFRQSDGLLVVATFGNGIYQINLQGPGGVLSTNENSFDYFNSKLYPNPTSEKINLSFNLNYNEDYRWIIFNQMGTVVKQSSNLNGLKGGNNININLSGFSDGVYFLSLKSRGNSITKEFIVNKVN